MQRFKPDDRTRWMEGLEHYPQQVVNKEAEARLHWAGGGGVWQRWGEGTAPTVEFSKEQTEEAEKSSVRRALFCSKDRIPSIFFMPDVLIKEKKKAKFHKWFAKTCRRLKRQTRPRDILWRNFCTGSLSTLLASTGAYYWLIDWLTDTLIGFKAHQP